MSLTKSKCNREAAMKPVYVWEFPVRLSHWLNVFSIIILSITGFYIGSPFINARDTESLVTAYMRGIHFIAAYVFTVSVLLRIYWWFAGNKNARLNQFIPTNRERLQNIYQTGMFYAFCQRTLPHSQGHTGLAGLSYAFLFLLYFMEIITGFAMLSVANGGGAVWTILGGWSLSLMSVAYLRLIHHMTMWIIWFFVIAHVYIGWHNDLIERNGLISSIFSGYKNLPDEH
jgi:Ni/Fe-hydrogenase 1 B-type cytochrome subunit